jgi:hypothetical protein
MSKRTCHAQHMKIENRSGLAWRQTGLQNGAIFKRRQCWNFPCAVNQYSALSASAIFVQKQTALCWN